MSAASEERQQVTVERLAALLDLPVDLVKSCDDYASTADYRVYWQQYGSVLAAHTQRETDDV